jgi:tetratricopeptide (TPR) repeat protein
MYLLMLSINLLWSSPLSSYQDELEQRVIHQISEMIEKNQNDEVQRYVERFQIELFYSSKLYYDTALLYNQKSDFEYAIRFYNQLLTKNPIHRAGLFDRAELFILQKKYDLAWIDLQTLESNNPKHGLWIISLKQAEVSAYQENEWNFEKYLMQSLDWGMDPYYLTTLGSNWYYWCRHKILGPSLYASFSDIEERDLILKKICTYS